MLSIVPTVHEAVLECDLQAEGQMLNLIFALDIAVINIFT